MRSALSRGWSKLALGEGTERSTQEKWVFPSELESVVWQSRQFHKGWSFSAQSMISCCYSKQRKAGLECFFSQKMYPCTGCCTNEVDWCFESKCILNLGSSLLVLWKTQLSWLMKLHPGPTAPLGSWSDQKSSCWLWSAEPFCILSKMLSSTTRRVPHWFRNMSEGCWLVNLTHLCKRPSGIRSITPNISPRLGHLHTFGYPCWTFAGTAAKLCTPCFWWCLFK